MRISAVDTPFPYSAKSNAISLRHRKIERNFITEQYRTLPEPPELTDKQSRENIRFFRCKCDYYQKEITINAILGSNKS